ncbi:MAG: hypothetical protein JW709_11790, partial [Sedimentisphaerales bacterium]|nr:hypothetical protein [Sedimentisphaerales bacterium]
MFEKRLVLFIAVITLTLGALVGRLHQLQIKRGPEYVQAALDSLRRPSRDLHTLRGQIRDRHGRRLAYDTARFDLCLNYRFTRLFEEDFWRGIQLLYFPSGEGTVKDVRQCLRDEFGFSSAQARDFKPRPTDDHSLAFNDFQRFWMDHAENLLADIARLTDGDIYQFKTALTQGNADIHHLAIAVARRKYYQLHQAELAETYRPLSGDDLEADFIRLLPDPLQRYRFLAQNPIREMNGPLPIWPNLQQDVALLIAEQLIGQPGPTLFYERPITIEVNAQRCYPYNEVACHLIGQVRRVRPDEIPPDTPSNDAPPGHEQLSVYQLRDTVGDWGMERLFETRLRGIRGWFKDHADPTQQQRIEPQPGRDVQLTLDIEFQKTIGNFLTHPDVLPPEYLDAPLPAAAVVIDVPTGDVLAMVSSPTFDLNTYYESENFRLINQLGIDDPLDRYVNRAIMRNYRPGSSIKPTILLGALEAGIVGPDTAVFCHRSRKYWQGLPDDIENHGELSARRALEVSCNFYFTLIGDHLGPARTIAWLETSGFHQRQLTWPDEVDAAAVWPSFRETSGNVAPINPVTHTSTDVPGGQAFRLLCIGRGPLDTAVLHMANSAATIARGGVYLPPTLIAEPAVNRTPRRIASEQNARIVAEGMEQVINRPGGTAYSAFHQPDLPWPPERVRLGGKTGTAEYSVFIAFARADDGRTLA